MTTWTSASSLSLLWSLYFTVSRRIPFSFSCPLTLPSVSVFFLMMFLNSPTLFFYSDSFSLFLLCVSNNVSLRSFISFCFFKLILQALCHCSYNSCLSLCAFLNSSATESNSICVLCVSVTSLSISLVFLLFSMVRRSIDRVISLILISSCLRYFSSVRLSSSFCLDASAHCSSSSWFQFISSLNWSSFSFPVKVSAWIELSLSWSSIFTFFNLAICVSVLSHWRLVKCNICFSEDISSFFFVSNA
mmetsp:Transcript_43360/g.36321  ORF Transcript_43360/g.36321 Transcript_43360/m.36321 type:complete len:246 (-) Transcript_43360:208-945(-)